LRALSVRLPCAACLVWPAWLLGDEAARWFRWLVDRVVSRSDSLFSVAMSDAGSMRCIGAGLGLLDRVRARDRLLRPCWFTRWLAGRALSWLSVALGAYHLVGIRLVWDWDADDSFLLARSRSRWRPIRQRLTPARSAFSSVFSAALVLAATPWRYKPPTL